MSRLIGIILVISVSHLLVAHQLHATSNTDNANELLADNANEREFVPSQQTQSPLVKRLLNRDDYDDNLDNLNNVAGAYTANSHRPKAYWLQDIDGGDSDYAYPMPMSVNERLKARTISALTGGRAKSLGPVADISDQIRQRSLLGMYLLEASKQNDGGPSIAVRSIGGAHDQARKIADGYAGTR